MIFINTLLKNMRNSLRDMLPIIIVIVFFQVIVLQQALPNVLSIIIGLVFVVIGLTFFIIGLEQALFPIGETLAQALAKKGSLMWLIIFAFGLGFGTTIAEPALTSIAKQAAEVASNGNLIAAGDEAKNNYALWLRITVALSVGCAILVGVLRIVRGWSISLLIVSGYIIIIILTFFAPKAIVGIAYDSGGVTTSTITVPLVTALGVGLSSVIRGRNPMLDGFGLIALASLFPMIFVLIYGMILPMLRL